MDCMTCGDEMICYDEVNDETLRIDWFRCVRCSSWAEIAYNKKGLIGNTTLKDVNTVNSEMESRIN